MGWSTVIGALLRASYAPEDALPLSFTALLQQPEERSGGAARERAFKAELTRLIPALRGYARNLCRDEALADDLVQDTMLRAWAARDRFRAGTSMKAWTHTILRNGYLSRVRRNRFAGAWDERMLDTLLVAPPAQEAGLHLRDVARGLARLPVAQRDVLVMVGAEEVTYERTAELCGAPLGTIKSRVARGRAALTRYIEGDEPEEANA